MMKGLAIDGGGIFGFGPARVLSLVSRPERFQFYAGTSVGAMVAAMVASGRSRSAPDLFSKWGPLIFGRRDSWFLTPKYDDRGLNECLQTLFPGKFGDCAEHLYIMAADLDRRRLRIFRSDDADDAEWPLWEVLRASVAAPTYFLPWKGFTDGGIYANNPSALGVSLACYFAKTRPQDVVLCSLGAGERIFNSNVGSTRCWLRSMWGLYVLRSQLGGAANNLFDVCSRLLPLKAYARIQFRRRAGWKMDDPGLVPAVLDSAWGRQIAAGATRVQKLLDAE